MKLAEALQERADLNRKIEQLKMRLSTNCMVQEGEKTAEDPKALLKELDGAIDRLGFLMAAINKTNCETVTGGKTLTQLIAEKDALNVKLAAYRDLAYEAGQNTRRARSTEIKILPTVDIALLQRKADEIAKEIRIIDNTLQATNWTVDLIGE
ncbi:MAG: DIP1984 family protein [Oscillospiraceae bacterium]|nr:DIP1984 family protein [Oscillospiraceae bacterium]